MNRTDAHVGADLSGANTDASIERSPYDSSTNDHFHSQFTQDRQPALMRSDQIVLVLTSTIDPGDMRCTARNDPKIRLQDYQRALQCWLNHKEIRKIVYCDNSGTDLAPLIDTFKRCNPYDKDVEFLSFDGNKFPMHKGKGYGEIEILSHVSCESRIFESSAYFIKMTGRLYTPNVSAILKTIKDRPEVFAFCNIGSNMTYAECRIFAAQKLFIERYLVPLQNVCDEIHGINMERVVARAIHQAMADGLEWSMMPMVPRVHGYSGTHGVKYRYPFMRYHVAELVRRVKTFVLSRR